MRRTGLVVLALLAGACSSSDGDGNTVAERPSTADDGWSVALTPDVTLVDEPVAIEVDGGETGDEVTLRLGVAGVGESIATFAVGDDRRILTSRDAPVSGSYGGVDADGLFWSVDGPSYPDEPAPAGQPTEWEVTVTVEHDGRDVATTRGVRRLHDGLDHVRSDPATDGGVAATLYSPRTGCPCPTVLVLGGSEGGTRGSQWPAALLASHGFATVAVAYFGAPGRPPVLADVPVEDVSAALDWALDQGPAREPAGIMGTSRGSELALEAAILDERLRAVVAIAPSHVRWPSLLGTGPAWTVAGDAPPYLQPVIPDGTTRAEGSLRPTFEAALGDQEAVQAAEIEVERIEAPVLLVSGRDDALWPSSRMAEAIATRRTAIVPAARTTVLDHPDAGHGPFQPGLPTTMRVVGGLELGGTPAGQARAAAESWDELRDFLAAELYRRGG